MLPKTLFTKACEGGPAAAHVAVSRSSNWISWTRGVDLIYDISTLFSKCERKKKTSFPSFFFPPLMPAPNTPLYMLHV